MGRLVGLVGFLGSGKGTVGDLLVENHGYRQDSFARSLKDAASVIFNWDREMVEGSTYQSRVWRDKVDKFWSVKLNNPKFTPRLALQLLGTEAGRQIFGNQLWTSGLEKRWYDASMPNTVITDCRFVDEIKLIRDLGGTVIRVKRGPEPKWYQLMMFHNRGLTDEEDLKEIGVMKATGIIPHESETAWIGSDFDEIIENESTLKALEERVSDLVENMLGGETQYTLDLYGN